MPLATKTIPLQHPLVNHNETITEAVIRQPNLLDFFEIGTPMLSMNISDDRATYVENDAALNRYLERCLVSPSILILSGQATLLDAMNIKEGLIGFFVEAMLAKNSPSSPTSPSSN